MIPMWPFNRRSVTHRTFGKIHPVRNGRFWKAMVPFEAARAEVELQINAGDEGPTDAQEKLYLLLRTHDRKVLQTALKAMHAEYRASRMPGRR